MAILSCSTFVTVHCVQSKLLAVLQEQFVILDSNFMKLHIKSLPLSNASIALLCQLLILLLVLFTIVGERIHLISPHPADILMAVYMLTAPGITIFFLGRECIETQRRLKKLYSSKKRHLKVLKI